MPGLVHTLFINHHDDWKKSALGKDWPYGKGVAYIRTSGQLRYQGVEKAAYGFFNTLI
jgi:hypothetical protein